MNTSETTRRMTALIEDMRRLSKARQSEQQEQVDVMIRQRQAEFDQLQKRLRQEDVQRREAETRKRTEWDEQQKKKEQDFWARYNEQRKGFDRQWAEMGAAE